MAYQPPRRNAATLPNECFSRSNWNKFQTRTNPEARTQEYSKFATASKYKTELQRIMQKEIPETPYVITIGSDVYNIHLYQSQWSALRRILLSGHPIDFEPMPMSKLITELKYSHSDIQSVYDSIKTVEILNIYLTNGMEMSKLDVLLERAKDIAAAHAADGRLL